MKIEIRPTGEPLTQRSLEEALEKIAAIKGIPGVQVVMKPTRIRFSINGDGTLRLGNKPWWER